MIGSVAGLWRYPVKSMAGEELETAEIGERGLAGDRAYALIDRATGKVVSAKHPRLWGVLLTCRATFVGRTIQIILPDGRDITVEQASAETVLSTLLGREVILSNRPPEAPEIERYWPDIDGLALRDTITSGAIGMGAPPGTFLDYAPVHLLTTVSLAHLQAAYPAGQVDRRRFRPNLLIAPAGDVDGFLENEWVGRTIRIGARVRLRVTDPTPRCVIPTLPQGDELGRDIGVLRTIATRNRPPIPALGGAMHPCLGVYAVVEQGGTIRRGDTLWMGEGL